MCGNFDLDIQILRIGGTGPFEGGGRDVYRDVGVGTGEVCYDKMDFALVGPQECIMAVNIKAF